MRGLIHIEVNGGQIPLLFKTKTLAKFCKMNGNLSVTDMHRALANPSVEQTIDLLWCAAEEGCKSEKKQFNYTKDEITEWIDEMGGLAGKKYIELSNQIAWQIYPEQMEQANPKKDEPSDDEKKILVGESSTDLQQPVV